MSICFVHQTFWVLRVQYACWQLFPYKNMAQNKSQSSQKKSLRSFAHPSEQQILDQITEPKKSFLHGLAKVLNSIAIITILPGYIFLLFYGVFVRVTAVKTSFFSLNYSMIAFVVYCLTMLGLAIYNDSFKIPRLKKKATQLPEVGIQIIGRGEVYKQFFAVVNNMRNIDYPQELIKKIVLAVDGDDDANNDMVKVFQDLYPYSQKVLLTKHFSKHTSKERKQILQKYQKEKYLIIIQPHGGRRQVKYTAFSFSSSGTEYVFHSDSDTIVNKNSLRSMASTAAGFNAENPDLKPCGGVVGEIRIMNVFNYFTFHMEISYWYAFNASRSSQSTFNCVTTISGAMGLFNSAAMKSILQDYANQMFLCGTIKCVFGEDRHLTSGLIINGNAVLYDRDAIALTESPKSVHGLIIQQSRWYKGFYRENFVYLPNIFYFNWWSALVINVSFSLPTLTLLHLFYSQIQGVNNMAFFVFFVFCITLISSIRGIIRNKKFRFIHCMWHPIFYYFFLMPCKMLAMVDIPFQDNKKICQSRCMKVCHVYLWLVVGSGIIIGYGFLYNILVQHEKLSRWISIALIIELTILVLVLVHWLTWGLGYYVQQNMKKHEQIYEDARMEGFINLGVSQNVVKLIYNESTKSSTSGSGSGGYGTSNEETNKPLHPYPNPISDPNINTAATIPRDFSRANSNSMIFSGGIL